MEKKLASRNRLVLKASGTILLLTSILALWTMSQTTLGQIFVASNGSNTIGEYDLNGTAVNASLISGLDNPLRIALFGSKLFVTNYNVGTVGEYNLDGTVVNASLISGLNNPRGIAVSGSSLFVVSQSGTNGLIGEYTTSGMSVNPLFITGLNTPLAIGISGTSLYVTNGDNIALYTTSGALVNASLITGLNVPYGIAVSGTNLFVTSNKSGTVGEYTSSGLTVNSSLISGLGNPSGIAVSGSMLFVARMASGTGGTIAQYTTLGVVVNTSLVPGLTSPTGIAVVPEPSVWVSLVGGCAVILALRLGRAKAKIVLQAKSRHLEKLRFVAFGVVLLMLALAAGANAGAVRTGTAYTFTTTLDANDDQSTEQVDLGFPVNFFGTSGSTVYINNNGNVTFINAMPVPFTPYSLNIVRNTGPIIAPFFADVCTLRGRVVTYGTSSVGVYPAFVVNWPYVGYFDIYQPNVTGTNKLNNFQLVIIDRSSDTGAGNFDFEFNYDQVQWEEGTASGGYDGLGANHSARVGWSNDAGLAFELAGSGTSGSFLDSGTNASTVLIYNNLNSGLNGRYLFQVRNAPGRYWYGHSSNSWSGANWVTDPNGTIGTSLSGTIGNAIFSATGATNQNPATLGSNITIHQLIVNDSADVTISGANTLTITGSSGVVITGNIGIAVTGSAGQVVISSDDLVLGDGAIISVDNDLEPVMHFDRRGI